MTSSSEPAATPAVPSTRLILIRHGESQVTVERTIGGFRTCSGLSELGRRQVERLCDRFRTTREVDGAVLMSSNFERALETARMLAPAMGDQEVTIDPGFGEHDPGPDLDGLTFDDYVDRFGTPNWDGDPHHDVFPGGETMAEFHLRVGATLFRTITRYAGQPVVVACHGGVIDAAFRQLLRTAPTGTFELWTRNASLSEFQLLSPTASGEPRWRLVRYNDAAHLAGLPARTERAS